MEEKKEEQEVEEVGELEAEAPPKKVEPTTRGAVDLSGNLPILLLAGLAIAVVVLSALNAIPYDPVTVVLLWMVGLTAGAGATYLGLKIRVTAREREALEKSAFNALRRLSEIETFADEMKSDLARRAKETDVSLPRETMEHIVAQNAQLLQNIRSSKRDWEKIIYDEFEEDINLLVRGKIRDVERGFQETLDAMEQLIEASAERVQPQLDKTREATERLAAETSRKVNEQLKANAAELEKMRSRVVEDVENSTMQISRIQETAEKLQGALAGWEKEKEALRQHKLEFLVRDEDQKRTVRLKSVALKFFEDLGAGNYDECKSCFDPKVREKLNFAQIVTQLFRVKPEQFGISDVKVESAVEAEGGTAKVGSRVTFRKADGTASAIRIALVLRKDKEGEAWFITKIAPPAAKQKARP